MKKDKKKIYKQWWFYLIIIMLLIIGVFSQSENKDSINNNQNISNGNIVEEEKDKMYVVDSFINKYNNTDVKILNEIEFETQNKENGYYRTEFRLDAFKDAAAKHGTIGNSTIDIINYNITNKYAPKDGEFRVYVKTSTEEEMKEILKRIINIIDSTVTEEEINEVYNTVDSVGSKSILMGQNKITGYIQKNEIMVDTSKINFLN